MFTLFLDNIATKDSVDFLISDPSIITLTSSKAIVGLAKGTVVLTAQLKSDPSQTTELIVKVVVGISAINALDDIVFLNMNQTHKVLYQLTTTVGTVTEIVANSDVSDTLATQLVFQLSDSSIADITYNGLLIPHIDGTVVVYVSYAGDSAIKDSMTITVRPDPVQVQLTAPVDTLSITATSADGLSSAQVVFSITEFVPVITSTFSTISINSSQYQLEANVMHSDSGVVWSSSNGTILHVDPASGQLTSYNDTGTVVITAISKRYLYG